MWKPIPGYEGLYSANELGQLLSHKGKKKLMMIIKEDKVKSYSPNCSGYVSTSLHKNKVIKKWLVHRLIAMTFIPNPENKPFVNHINGIRHDNRVENLEWCTAAENLIHAYRFLNKKPYVINKGKFGIKNHLSIQIVGINKNGVEKIFGSICDAAIFLGDRRKNTHISDVVNGKRKTAYGYTWRVATKKEICEIKNKEGEII